MVGEEPDWQPELGILLEREGYTANRVGRLDAVVPLLATGAVQALFLTAAPLAASDLLLLRHVREVSPHTAIIVVTKTPTDPDLKRAFENGATAFLSWPASAEALRHAIDRCGGEAPGGAPSNPRKSPVESAASSSQHPAGGNPK